MNFRELKNFNRQKDKFSRRGQGMLTDRWVSELSDIEFAQYMELTLLADDNGELGTYNQDKYSKPVAMNELFRWMVQNLPIQSEHMKSSRIAFRSLCDRRMVWAKDGKYLVHRYWGEPYEIWEVKSR